MELPKTKILIVRVTDLANRKGIFSSVLCFREVGILLRTALDEIIQPEIINYDAVELNFSGISNCDGTFLDELVVITHRRWKYKDKLFYVSMMEPLVESALDMWLYGLAGKSHDRITILCRSKKIFEYELIGPIEPKLKKVFKSISFAKVVTARDMIEFNFASDISTASTLLGKMYSRKILLRKRDDSVGYIQHYYYLPNFERSEP